MNNIVTNLDLLFDIKTEVCKNLIKSPSIYECLNQEEGQKNPENFIKPKEKILPYLFDDTERITSKQSFIMIETFLQNGNPSNILDSFNLYILYITHKDLVKYHSMTRLDYLITESNKIISQIDKFGSGEVWVRQVKLYQTRNPDYYAKVVTFQIDGYKDGLCSV